MSDHFYRDFEDRHRGSRELIKSRLRAYLPFIEPLRALPGAGRAIDLGCGRGEWLELLGEWGFTAEGVDLDAAMLEACQERGLQTRTADALEALRALPAASLALVSSFHLVEHLPFAELRAIVLQALRVLEAGGLLILETPNPENLVVGATSFYTDPSHLRPLPPELLGFVVEHAGFARRKLVRLQESAALTSTAPVDLFSVLEGTSRDYAIVAQKAAPAALSDFDPAFAADYGVCLEPLARRYDLQAEARTDAMRGALVQAEAESARRFDEASRQIAQLDERLLRAETAIVNVEAANLRADAAMLRAEAATAQAEARAAQLASYLDGVLNSRSWRITQPLRGLGADYRALRAGVRRLNLVASTRRRSRSLVRWLARAAWRSALLRRLALAALDRLPGLRRRLRAVVFDAAGAVVDPAPLARAPHLRSPRSARILDELLRAVEAGKR